MRSIFKQYGELLQARKQTVAERGGGLAEDVDLRTGWMLWQESLREFLYFEETTVSPDPDEYYAEWVEKGDGKRKGSRNLWIYHAETGVKRYSLTTSAGVKLQPYFDVPGAKDPNLYHWTIIGEVIDTGDVRIWLTQRTAEALQGLIGSLERDAVSKFVLEAAAGWSADELSTVDADDVGAVVEVVITEQAYKAIGDVFPSTNDDHLIQQLIDESSR